MDTRSEMEAELLAQLQVSTNSSLYPSARLTSLIQNSYKSATSLFKWLALSRAKTTSTSAKAVGADVCYYDYPPEFRTNTIFRVQIDGKEYNRKGFNSFLDYRNRYTTGGNKRIFANYQRYLFVSPDTEEGTDNMDVWGIIQAPELSAPTSETIFTGNADDCNMAVVGLAFSLAMKKVDPKLADKEKAEAIATLIKTNTDEWDEYAKDQQLDTPLFEVPDFFGKPDINNMIGQFNYDLFERY